MRSGSSGLRRAAWGEGKRSIRSGQRNVAGTANLSGDFTINGGGVRVRGRVGYEEECGENSNHADNGDSCHCRSLFRRDST